MSPFGVLTVGVCRCHQVCSVLESLEREYRREEDWCEGAVTYADKPAYMRDLAAKHQEQKEAFLKVGQGRRRRRRPVPVLAATSPPICWRDLSLYKYVSKS